MELKKHILSNEKRSFIQDRVSHFLLSLRLKQDLTQEQLAKETGLTINQVKTWECKSRISSIVSAYEALFTLASIKKMTVTRFVAFLDQETIENTDSQNFDWEKILLSRFKNLRIDMRRKLIHQLFPKISDDEFNKSIELMMEYLSFDKTNQELMTLISKKLSERKSKAKNH